MPNFSEVPNIMVAVKGYSLAGGCEMIENKGLRNCDDLTKPEQKAPPIIYTQSDGASSRNRLLLVRHLENNIAKIASSSLEEAQAQLIKFSKSIAESFSGTIASFYRILRSQR